MTTPKPSSPVRGSTSGRPVMALLDLLGRRMSLRALWELRAGPLTFRALQELAATNPSVLNVRLKELREARLVQLGPNGYELTALGRSLLTTFAPLNAWSNEWARSLKGARGASKAEAPKGRAPKAEAPKGRASKRDAPKAEAPKGRAPKGAPRAQGRGDGPPAKRRAKAAP